MYHVEEDGDWTIFTSGPTLRSRPAVTRQSVRPDYSASVRSRATGSRAAAPDGRISTSSREPVQPVLSRPVRLPAAPARPSTDARVEVFSMSPRADPEINIDNGWTLTAGGASDSSAPASPETVAEPDHGDLADTPEFTLRGTPATQESDNLPSPPLERELNPPQKTRQPSDSAGDVVSLNADEFVHVQPTCMSLFRLLTLRRHRLARASLWAWFALLIMGELGTTLWWLQSLGLKGLLVMILVAALVISLALSVLSPEQVLAIATSVTVAAIPALPAYSAVLLVAPSEVESSADCWEALHLPTLFSLAVMYIASAVLPALRAEYPLPGERAKAVLTALEVAQRLARGVCVLALWVYLSCALHLAAIGGRLALPSLPIHAGRGFVLALHLLGFACAEARFRTVAALGDDLLPSLFGAQRAKSLTLRALAYQHGRGLLRNMPTLRRCVPPKFVVALIISLRRTAPALLPGFALLTQLWRFGLPRLAALLALAIVSLICAIASSEWLHLPHSPLRRLPLLLPPKVAPCTRKALGYALAFAEGLSGAHAGISYLGIGRRPLRGASERVS